MIQRIRSLWLLLPALALIAAAPASTPPDELVRQGNAAANEQHYPEALKLYGQAEDRATEFLHLAGHGEGVVLQVVPPSACPDPPVELSRAHEGAQKYGT